MLNVNQLCGFGVGSGDAGPWTRILNVGGDTSTSGTVSVSGYTEILVFGVAPGGSGGNGGDDDGGGGGGSGAAQLDGYKVTLPAGTTSLYYTTPNPATVNTDTSNPGAYQSNLKIERNGSGGDLLFELKAGRNGACNDENSFSAAPGGLGGAVGTYGSASGVSGGAGATRLPQLTAVAGTNKTSGPAGGGGGGAWNVSSPYAPTAGAIGGTSTANVSIASHSGSALNIQFTAAGVSGGTGGGVYPSTANGGAVADADGGLKSYYASGGGAGGGIQFFGTGNYYGAGGGGTAGQNNRTTYKGMGGAAYLVIYAR
jgi:hypothetical protein